MKEIFQNVNGNYDETKKEEREEKSMKCQKITKQLFITFILLSVCLFNVMNSPMRKVEAAGTTSLQSLMDEYVGTYWTTDGKASDSSGSTSKYYYGIQCKGFASYIFYRLFDVKYIGAYDSNKYYIPKPSGATEIGKAWNFSKTDTATVSNLLSKGQPGDFIQVRRRGKSWGHSMILVSKDSKGITVFDCNSDGKCGVRKYYITWSSFASSNVGVSLYHAKNYIQQTDAHKPTGYTISVSSSVIYDSQYVEVKVIANEQNITNYKLYFVDPQGRKQTVDLGTKNSKKCTAQGGFGKWTVYASITNKYGTLTGTTTNGAIQFTVTKPDLGKAVDIGTDFYATIRCDGDYVLNCGDDNNVSKKPYMNYVRQVWRFERQSDNSYKIINKRSKLVLDADNAKGLNETNVKVYADNGSVAQRWFIYSAGNGSYYLMPKCSNSAVLDIYAGGSNAQLYTWNKGSNQKFKIERWTDNSSLVAKATVESNKKVVSGTVKSSPSDNIKTVDSNVKEDSKTEVENGENNKTNVVENKETETETVEPQDVETKETVAPADENKVENEVEAQEKEDEEDKENTTSTKNEIPKVAIKKLIKEKRAIIVKLQKNSCSYEVQQYEKNRKQWKTIKVVNPNDKKISQFSITKLKRKTKYQFRIRPFKRINNKTIYGEWKKFQCKTK